MRRNVLVIVEFFPPAYQAGGPVRSAEALVETYTGEAQIRLLTRDRDLSQDFASPAPKFETRARGRISICRVASSREMLRELVWSGPRVTHVYLNSILSVKFSLAPLLLTRLLPRLRHIRITVAPRGELDPGALAIKSLKKRIYLELLQLSRALNEVSWHSTSDSETLGIRKIFPRAEVLQIENPTMLPPRAESPSPPSPVRRLAYVGRITPKKGLDVLLAALKDQTRPAQLDVFGSHRDDELKYLNACKKAADQLPSYVAVRFMGALPHEELKKNLRDYDLFASPTAGENFGHSIIEALQNSLPVMIPPTTPWTSQARRLGTLVEDLEPETWAVSLERFLALDDDKIAQLKIDAGRLYNHWKDGQADSPHLFEELR